MPTLNIFRRPTFLVLFLFLVTSIPGFGWSFHTHRKITSDALNRMPAEFQKRFLPYKEAILTGCTDPDSKLKDFQNHVFHVRSTGRMRESANYLKELFFSLAGRIQRKEPDEEIAHVLGLYSHYIADLNQPLHTAGEDSDPDEDSYHMKFEKDVEGQLSKIPLGTFTYEPVTKPVERLTAMTEKANREYLNVGKAYRIGNRIFDVQPMVNEQYNEAVKNVIDYWLGIFREGGLSFDLSIPPGVGLAAVLPPATASSGASSIQAFVLSSQEKSLPVNINTASQDQLMQIPGVGEKKAKAILEARPFKSIYDLAKVKGFGVKLIERISDRITVGP